MIKLQRKQHKKKTKEKGKIMQDTQKTKLFEETAIPKAVAQLAVPTILSSLVMVIYNLADTYFVGMLNNSTQNAAVTLAGPVLLAFNAANNLFGVGSSSMMSRSLGKKDYNTLKKSSAFGFYCALICGVIFALLCTVFKDPLLIMLGADAKTAAATGAYMRWTVTFGAVPAILNVVMAYLFRAEGASLHASIGTMSGCLLNIVLDPIFILPWGLDMGAEGAGLATFISNCVACLYFFVLMYKRRGMTILNNFTSSFGSEAVAAMGITQKVNMVPMYIAMGLSQGIMPLISYNYASGNHKRMKHTVLFSAALSVGFMIPVATLYYLFSGPLTSLFIGNEAIIAYGASFLRGFCLSLPFMCIDFLAVGVFQSVGMGKESLIFCIMRKIVLEIPALYILNKVFPLYGLAYAQFIAEFVLAGAAIFVLTRLFKKIEKNGVAVS